MRWRSSLALSTGCAMASEFRAVFDKAADSAGDRATVGGLCKSGPVQLQVFM